MPLSKARDKERKRTERAKIRLEKLVSSPYQRNVVQPIQWYTCELTEDVGCGKPLKERGVKGCAGCSIYQRVQASPERFLDPLLFQEGVSQKNALKYAALYSFYGPAAKRCPMAG